MPASLICPGSMTQRLWLPGSAQRDPYCPDDHLVRRLEMQNAIGRKNLDVRRCAFGLLSFPDKRVALFHRPKGEEWYPDTFCVAGGHCGPNEDHHRTVVKEHWQELGVDSVIVRELGVAYAAPPERRVLFIVYGYCLCLRNIAETIRLNEEHDGLFIGTPEEAFGLPLADPFVQNLLQFDLSSPLH